MYGLNMGGGGGTFVAGGCNGGGAMATLEMDGRAVAAIRGSTRAVVVTAVARGSTRARGSTGRAALTLLTPPKETPGGAIPPEGGIAVVKDDAGGPTTMVGLVRFMVWLGLAITPAAVDTSSMLLVAAGV